MSPNPTLTPKQDQVLALISAGFSTIAAAQQAGIHRNTVANWLRSEQFKSALADARNEKQLLYWDQAEILAAEAIADLRKLKDDPQAPAAVRLRAIMAVLDHARKFIVFLPTEPGLVLPDPAGLPAEPAPISETVHKNAQPEPQNEAATPAPQPEPPLPNPKPGRNEPCPCGSGLKFKYCCLRKTSPGYPPGAADAPAA
jgi:hypothetical protein